MDIVSNERGISKLDSFILFIIILVLTDPELENISLIYYVSMGMVFARALTLIRRKVRIEAYGVWTILLLLIYGFSCAYATNTYYALDMYKTVVFRVILYFYAYVVVRSLDDIEHIMEIIIVASSIMVVHALAISNKVMLFYLPLGVSTLNELWNANTIANYALFSAMFSLYFLFTKKSELGKMRNVYIVIYIVMIIIQLLTRSKSAMLISAIVTIGVMYKNNKKNILKLFCSSLVIVFLFAVISKTELFYELIAKNFNTFFDYFVKGVGRNSYESTSMRVEMIKFGLEKSKDSVVLGYGLNNYRALFSLTKWNVYGIGGTYSHNNYIELLVNNGIIGLVAYYTMYFYLISRLRKMRDKVSFIFLGMIFVFLISDLSKVSYYAMIFQLWICLICKYVEIRKDAKEILEKAIPTK